MELTVNLVQTEQELVELIMSQYKEYINNALRGAAMPVRRRITDAIRAAILTSPEINSLLNGELKQSFGLTSPQQVVDNIISALLNSMTFTQENVQSIGSRIISGGYTVEISRSDFRDVLGIPDATILSKNNITIPWLNWLLFAGDSPVIIGYVIKTDMTSPNSRAGAIMVRKPGGSWGVPSEFAGTVTDNFITRALLPLQDEIGDILQEEISRRL